MPVRDEAEHRIPLFEERVHVGTAEIETDRVRVATRVEERPVTVAGEVERGDLRVERVAVNRAVAETPEPWRDGDTLVVPVVEERLVVEKRLFVVEEVRVTRVAVRERVELKDSVRAMRAVVERTSVASEQGRED